jgi:hypothetical protein
MSSEPRLFRYEHRRYGTLDAVSDFVVATNHDEATRLVKSKLDEKYGDGQYVVSEIVESSFEDLPDDEAAFEKFSREMDKRRPKPPEVGPFFQLRVGEGYRQRMIVYSTSKSDAIEKASARLVAEGGGKYHSSPPLIHPAVTSLSIDALRARLSGRSSIFSALTPDDARQFVRDLLSEHHAALLDHHAEAVKRLKAEAAAGELCLPSASKPPKPSGLLLEGIEHVKANAAIDNEALPESVAAGTD